MDDDALKKDIDEEEEETEDDFGGDISDIPKKGKKLPADAVEDESLDALADEEDSVPEDSFDDVDLW